MADRRRRLLIGGAAVASGTALGWALIVPDWGPRLLADANSGLGAQTDALLRSWRGSSELARTWIESGDNASLSTADWAQRIRARLPGGASPPTTREALTALFREDFEQGRTERVDGWILSRTECDWAALRLRLYGSAEPSDTPTVETEGTIVEVSNWGPRETEVGRKVNEQSDGHSGIWFAAKGAPSWIKVRIAGEEMPTFVNEASVTSGLHGALQERILATPGEYPVEFVDSMSHTVQKVGTFKVSPRHPRHVHPDGRESENFCRIERYGPDRVAAGVNPNPQPDGSFGIWIRIPCAPRSARIVLDGKALETSIGPTATTAKASPALLDTPGRSLSIVLRDMVTGEEIPVGEISVHAAEPTPQTR